MVFIFIRRAYKSQFLCKFEYEKSDEYTNRRENYCEIIIEDEPEIITEEEFCDILKIIHTKLDEKLFSKFAKSK